MPYRVEVAWALQGITDVVITDEQIREAAKAGVDVREAWLVAEWHQEHHAEDWKNLLGRSSDRYAEPDITDIDSVTGEPPEEFWDNQLTTDEGTVPSRPADIIRKFLERL